MRSVHIPPMSESAVQRTILALRREIASLIGNGALAQEALTMRAAGAQRSAAIRIIRELPAKLQPLQEAYDAMTRGLALAKEDRDEP